MPSVPAAVDLFDQSAADFDARWQEGERPAPIVASTRSPKDFAAAKALVWDPSANVLGVLIRPMTAEDICRFTGLMPEQVGAALCKLQGEGRVRRCGGGMWERA